MPQDGLTLFVPGEDPKGVREEETLCAKVPAHRQEAAFREFSRGKDELLVEPKDGHDA
jgi:hypothetical protein